MQQTVGLRFAVGNTHAAQAHATLFHDFSKSASCTSPDWNFLKAIDDVSQTIAVSVELLGENQVMLLQGVGVN
jgi:hypothetical protein